MQQVACKKCKQKFRREHGKAGPFLYPVCENVPIDSPHIYACPFCSTEFEITFKVDGVREIENATTRKDSAE